MSNFHFYYPVQIRYGDLDPQWHVNNAHTVTFIEQARLSYILNLGLFDGKSFFDLGVIVADLHIAYLQPIYLTQPVRIGVRVAKIGNKSMTFVYQVEDAENGDILATAETVMVAYNYHLKQSIRVPDAWRESILNYEGTENVTV